MDSDSELKLILLISKLSQGEEEEWYYELNVVISQIVQIISLVVSMDLDLQPKPESKLMSLVNQAICLFHSIDFDSMPEEPLSKLVSLISQRISDQELDVKPDLQLESLVDEILEFEPYPQPESDSEPESHWELVSLIRKIISTIVSIKSNKLILGCPKNEVYIKEGKFHMEKIRSWSRDRWECFFGKKEYILPGGDEVSHFFCNGCNGEYHKEYEKAPIEIKHPLQLVSLGRWSETRECYCCNEDLNLFYYCSSCDYAMNIACVEKTPVLTKNHPEWHEHPLHVFPNMTPIPCNACGLKHSTCPFYVCPPCDFVIHQKCITLPRVIRISRHPHRISFTPSFNQGDWSCGVCRRKIENDYGGYSCIKDDCLYVVHSRCATQKNVWDGVELEGVPEEIEEVVEPFERIADGIIRHFSHKHHHLRLDENTCGDYDEKKLCEACITPIYFGNFYTCEQCEFILHEKCANLSRKIYHPTHPHPLNLALVGENVIISKDMHNCCSICVIPLISGFIYKCGEGECDFKLNIKCSTIQEPLAHESHKHPLFLTSKPGEEKQCRFCRHKENETFNCIECDDFSLCFDCAAMPTKVRYKHDNHTLTLSHGEDKSTLTYWCEICEGKINSEERFYRCDEYCCVTLHIKCLIGEGFNMKPGLYMKPGSSFFCYKEISVLPNHSMSRPVCSVCEKRCQQKIVFQCSGSILCSAKCLEKILE